MTMKKEDSQKISDFQEMYAELVTEIAKNFFLEVEVETNKEVLKESARSLIMNQAVLHKEMTEKYGPGFLDLETED